MELQNYLDLLSETSQPLWGRMTVQEMIEHLEQSLMISNGKIQVKVHTPEEYLAKTKAFLFTEKDMPKMYESPILRHGLPPLRHIDLIAAKKALIQEEQDFYRYFKENPKATPNNPVFGPLNFEEWILFHKKHFRHHLGQFGIEF